MPIKSVQEKIRNFLKFLKIRTNRWYRNPEIIEKTGIAFVAVSVLLAFLIFFPVIREEIRYAISSKNNSAKVETRKEAGQNKDGRKENVITPVDEDFGIVIPKISANAKVIAEVDSQNSDIYQWALTKGVAHAKGSSYPGEHGNIFIFAHSSADFFEANRYNAVFYLLSKLETGDDIYLFYKKQKYHYRVAEKKTVGADDVKYLEKNAGDQLTLMTCWPPGTTIKRLIVVAEPVE
jgi:LPXTG-site transpeptidase (sortase) family protein